MRSIATLMGALIVAAIWTSTAQAAAVPAPEPTASPPPAETPLPDEQQDPAKKNLGDEDGRVWEFFGDASKDWTWIKGRPLGQFSPWIRASYYDKNDELYIWDHFDNNLPTTAFVKASGLEWKRKGKGAHYMHFDEGLKVQVKVCTSDPDHHPKAQCSGWSRPTDS